jgi:hypothetical protein
VVPGHELDVLEAVTLLEPVGQSVRATVLVVEGDRLALYDESGALLLEFGAAMSARCCLLPGA